MNASISDAAMELARPLGRDPMPPLKEYIPIAIARQLEKENFMLRLEAKVTRENYEEYKRENAALRADKERLDWLDRNMTSRDSIQTFGKEIPVGELRQHIDAAIQKEEQP